MKLKGGTQGQRFRHELKYEVSIAEADRFYERCLPYGSWDTHGGEYNSYEISSVYYDTADLRFYLDREESVGYRRKIRLRAYNNNRQAQALFIEIKEKHRNFVAKKRINLTSMDILSEYKRHDRLPLDAVIECLEDTAEAREIAYLHRRLRLHPVVIIRYIRRALIPTFEDDMRITLDTKITAGGEDIAVFDPDKEQHIIRPGYGVLEIKTNQSIPLWLAAIMGDFEFVQTRYSKYCLGVDKVYGPNRPWIATREEEGQAGESQNSKQVVHG